MSDILPKLDLATLQEGMPAVTPAFGASLAEAGAVCFEDQKHSCGVRLAVNGEVNTIYEVHWPTINSQTLRCWNDHEVTTECGAYGLAFLLIRFTTDYTVIERSRKGTGFDYWLGYASDPLFENKARLEVSGIRKGDNKSVKSRVRAKLKQTERSNGTLPAYIVVVEFSKPLSEVVKK